MKQFIFNMSKNIPMIRANLFGAIRRNINGWKKAIMGIHNKYAKGVREILKKANFDSKNSNNDNKKSKILMFGN